MIGSWLRAGSRIRNGLASARNVSTSSCRCASIARGYGFAVPCYGRRMATVTTLGRGVAMAVPTEMEMTLRLWAQEAAPDAALDRVAGRDAAAPVPAGRPRDPCAVANHRPLRPSKR